MGRFDRSVTLTDESGDPINVGNPLATTGSGGGGGGGTSQSDKSAFGEGTGMGTPIMGVVNDTPLGAVAEDKAAAVRITPFRGLHINVRDASGNELGTALAPFRIDPTGATVQPVSGTVTITDGGGSITVDGTLAVTQSGSWTVAATQSGSWSVAISGSVTVANLATADYDTGAGTVTQAMIGIALPASGGPVAGGTATNPIRMDPTGSTAQPVTDGGGSLTVDGTVSISGTVTVTGTVAATQSGTWAVQLTDGSLTASIRNTGSNDSLNVAIVDASGNQVSSFGGGTQYTEADVDSTPMGTVSMWWNDGDNSIHSASPTNPFPVTVVSGGGGGMVDDSPFTIGSDTVVPMGALFDDVATDSVDEGDIGAPRMSGSRILYVSTFAGSPVAVTDNGGSLTVDGTVSISGSVTVTGTVAATQSGAWTVTANAGSGTFTVDQVDTASLDYDSGAGTVNQTVIGLALPGAGGPVAGGTSTNPVRTDPTGTTTQPVSDGGGSLTIDGTVSISGSVTVTGTVAATQSGSWTVTANAGSGTFTVDQADTASLDYDSGAGTVNQTVLGIALPGSGGPVAGGTATDPLRTDPTGTTAQPITDNGGSLTVDGTVAVSSVAGNVTVVQATATNLKVDASGVAVPVTDNGGSLTVDGTVAISGSVTVTGTVAATQSGSWTVIANAGSGTFTVDQADTASLDYDSGAGTVNQTVIGIALPGSGGPVAGGTATNPVRMDPTGTTTQPVSGTVTIQDGGGSITVDGTVAVSAVSGNVTVVQSTATNLKVDASGVAVPVTDNSGSLTVDGTVAVAGTTASGVSLASTNPVYVGMNSGSGLGRHLTAIVSNRDTDGTAILGVAPVGWDSVNSLYRDLEVDTSTNLKVAQSNVNTADYDSGAGTVTQSMMGIALPASGGPVAGGSATNPVRTDPTGTTSQPVTGTVTINSIPAGTALIGSVKISDGTTVSTVRELGTNDALNVAICDGSGNQITSFGGGTPLTDDAPFTPGSGTGQGMFAFADETSSDSVDEGDAGIVRMTLDRILRTISQTENALIRVDGTQLTVKRASISIAATGDQTVITAVVSKKLRILGIAFSSTVICGVQLKSNATVVVERIALDKRAPFFVNMMPSGYIMETTAGEAFKMNTDTAGQLSGVVVYCEV